MALQSIGLGTTEGDGTGDSIRTGGDKINDNFSELYTLLGTGTALSSGISATATVVTLAAPSITGVASFADGSASAPAIANTGDANTGIFFSAADTVNITTGGTERVEIDSSGLDVTGAITATTTITATAGVAGTTGTFSAAVSGTTGTFSAAVSGTTGTFSSDVTGLTLNATGDTAASDNAAIGYTAAEGLILTGQGSTSDITLKNDADATVFTVPTGTDDILFPDGAMAMWGAASDLQIYHDGSNSIIKDNGTGNLSLRADDFQLTNSTFGENYITAANNGAVTLYHDNAVKLATSAAGGTLTGVWVTSANITDGTIVSADIANGTIVSADIADGTIVSADIADGTIVSADIADGQITTAKLATAVLTAATDIGEAIVDADLFLIDNGAGGTLRKTTAARIKTYAGSTGAITGITSVLNTSLVLGRDADNDIDFSADNIITFRAAGVDQVKLIDNVFSPVADSDVDLGTSSLFFKDAFIDTITSTGTITATGSITCGSSTGTGGVLSAVRHEGRVCDFRRYSTSGEIVHFEFGASTVGSISTDGSSTAYNTSSDYRLKENVDYNWTATTRLKKLKPARFNFISDATNTLVDGFLAHEAATVVPESVLGEKDATEMQGMDQSKLVPLLVKTIQEMEARITALEDD